MQGESPVPKKPLKRFYLRNFSITRLKPGANETAASAVSRRPSSLDSHAVEPWARGGGIGVGVSSGSGLPRNVRRQRLKGDWRRPRAALEIIDRVRDALPGDDPVVSAARRIWGMIIVLSHKREIAVVLFSVGRDICMTKASEIGGLTARII